MGPRHQDGLGLVLIAGHLDQEGVRDGDGAVRGVVDGKVLQLPGKRQGV